MNFMDEKISGAHVVLTINISHFIRFQQLLESTTSASSEIDQYKLKKKKKTQTDSIDRF